MTVHFTSSNVIALANRTAVRSGAEIDAAIKAEHARHALTIDGLYAERAAVRAGIPGVAPIAERRQNKKQAAAALGMSERKMMRLIVRYTDEFPDRAKLAVQPAGMKHNRWTVYTDRVKAVIDTGEPG